MTGPAGFLDGPVHLVGVGGVGMSAIALLLRERGVATSGSDGQESAVLDALRAAGVVVHVGHAGSNVPAGAAVVLSSAVRPGNPERVAAERAGLRVLHRSEALAALMADRRGVAVAGTHGKTTTTGMVTVVLQRCGLDPSFAIGGQLTDTGVGAHGGSGEAFVLEADESDGSFVRYRPEVAVITNVEPDHLDHYGTAEAVEDAFAEFCATVRPGGLVVACGDDAGVHRVLRRATPDLDGRGIGVVRYGTGAGNDVVVENLAETPSGVCFSIAGHGPVQLRVPGRYNALNAAAAWSVARHFGADGAAALAALATFGGTRRRFELRGEAGGVRVVDDYAHHPTEVREVLLAARAVAGDGRVVAIFQPHLPSRTKAFAAEFGQALALADEVLVLDVYSAREDPDPAVTGQLLVDHLDRRHGPPARFVADVEQVPALVAGLARPGDLVLTIGAGDVTRLGPAILAALGSAGVRA